MNKEVIQMLAHLLGRPTRVAGKGGAGAVRHGVLTEVADPQITARLFDSQAELENGPYLVEVPTENALVRFFAEGETDWVFPEQLHLLDPKEMEVVQRRESPFHARYQLTLPVWVRPIPSQYSDTPLVGWEPPPGDPSGYTLNISGSGAALLSQKLLQVNEPVLVSIGGLGGMYINGIKCRISRYGPGPQGLWFAAVQFTNADSLLSQILAGNAEAAASLLPR